MVNIFDPALKNESDQFVPYVTSKHSFDEAARWQTSQAILLVSNGGLGAIGGDYAKCIHQSLIGGGQGDGDGLNEAEVDARIQAIAPTIVNDAIDDAITVVNATARQAFNRVSDIEASSVEYGTGEGQGESRRYISHICRRAKRGRSLTLQSDDTHSLQQTGSGSGVCRTTCTPALCKFPMVASSI